MSFKIFLHGLESSNQGTKSVFFRENYPDIIIPNFVGTLWQRMDKLNRILSDKSGIRLVGSSFGGLMASIFAMENESRVDRMVLLAPAISLKIKEFILSDSDADSHQIAARFFDSIDLTNDDEKMISVPVRIYHGRDDEVLPVGDVENTAKKIFSNLSFHPVDDDHFLHKTFKTIEWDRHLKA